MMKYDFLIDSQEDEDLRCPICNYYFSNITKPYLLSCNHNLCVKCIDGIIAKNMLSCPICRKGFNEEDRKNYQVNFAFLNLVIKILKTKVIFCKKCSKIFNWVEHHSVCDQGEFKETNEIMEEIKKLAQESYMVIKYLDKHKNILEKTKNSIYESSNEQFKILNFKFYEHFKKTIETFFDHVPNLNFDSHIKEIIKYLELCRPLSANLNLTELKNISFNYEETNCVTSNRETSNRLRYNSLSSNYLSSANLTSKYFKQDKIDNNSFLITPFYNNAEQTRKMTYQLNSDKKSCYDKLNENYDPPLSKTTDNFESAICNLNKYLMNQDKDLNECVNESDENCNTNQNDTEYFIDNCDLDDSLGASEMNENIPSRRFKHMNANNSDLDVEETTRKLDNKNILKINLPRNLKKNENLFNRNFVDENLKNENLLENNKQSSSKTTNNTNIVNFNYNFNITELIEEKKAKLAQEASAKPAASPNKNKQKIIVRNDKIEILNVNNKIKLNEDEKPENKQCSSLRKLHESTNTDISPLKKLSSTMSDNNLFNNSIVISKSIRERPDTPKNHHETVNKILTNFNKTKDIVRKILNYTTQVEFTSETIKNQISTNYNLLSENILRSMSGLCDNISVNFTNSHKKYLINLVENTKKICLFDVKKMKYETKEFSNLSFSLKGASSIEFDDSDLIFITGGKCRSSIFDSDYNFSNIFLIIRWSNKSIEISTQMPRKRAFHSSFYFDNKLYLIGGGSNMLNSNNTLGNIKDCECYNIIDKRWELLPSLHYGRCNPSLCIYNGTYLYAFRGWSINKEENNFLDTIEFLNIKNISSGWTLVKPEDPGMTWYSCSNSVATVLSNDKILICGGYNNTTFSSNFTNGTNSNSKFYNMTFIYDPLRKSVYRSKDLCKSACFNSNGTVLDNNVYLIDWKNDTNKNFGIHIYEIENKTWKFYQN